MEKGLRAEAGLRILPVGFEMPHEYCPHDAMSRCCSVQGDSRGGEARKELSWGSLTPRTMQ